MSATPPGSRATDPQALGTKGPTVESLPIQYLLNERIDRAITTISSPPARPKKLVPVNGYPISSDEDPHNFSDRNDLGEANKLFAGLANKPGLPFSARVAAHLNLVQLADDAYGNYRATVLKHVLAEPAGSPDHIDLNKALRAAKVREANYSRPEESGSSDGTSFRGTRLSPSAIRGFTTGVIPGPKPMKAHLTFDEKPERLGLLLYAMGMLGRVPTEQSHIISETYSPDDCEMINMLANDMNALLFHMPDPATVEVTSPFGELPRDTAAATIESA